MRGPGGLGQMLPVGARLITKLSDQPERETTKAGTLIADRHSRGYLGAEWICPFKNLDEALVVVGCNSIIGLLRE